MHISMSHRKQHQCLVIFILLTVCLLLLLSYNQLDQTISNYIIAERPVKTINDVDNVPLLQLNDNNKSVEDEKANRLKTILIWTSPERIESIAGFGTGQQPFIDHNCPVSNCYIQVNESSEFWSRATANNSEVLKLFDAVVINSYNIPYLPDYERPARQRVIWLTQEAPGGKEGYGDIDKYPTMFDRVFNWTMSYKRDADIQLLYGQIHPILNRYRYIGLRYSKICLIRMVSFLFWCIDTLKDPEHNSIA